MRNPRIGMPGLLVLVAVACLFFARALYGAETGAEAGAETGAEAAWKLIGSSLKSEQREQRAAAVRVLGIILDDPQAAGLAEHALADAKPEVRSAAATALGQMHSTASIAKLKATLTDTEVSVVVAAARALILMKDQAGYDVYYQILTGTRKGNKGFIAEQTEILHQPKKLAEMGFEQGIGYIPYAGMGWDAVREIRKHDSSPIKAAAATILADDPDPKSAKALLNAMHDKNWVVRVAAIEAIAKRGDATLRTEIEPYMYDPKREVRYAAAAAVIRLADVARKQPAGEAKPDQ